MGSKYPRSLRCCLPLWAFVLQTAFIFLFWFVISQDTAQVDHKFMANYQGEGLGGRGQMVLGQRRSAARLPEGTGTPFYSQGEGFLPFHYLHGDSVGWALGVAWDFLFQSPTWICRHRTQHLLGCDPEFPVQMVVTMFYFSASPALSLVVLCCGVSVTPSFKKKLFL